MVYSAHYHALTVPLIVLDQPQQDDPSKTVVSHGQIVMKPSEHVEYSLVESMTGITPKNANTEANVGKTIDKKKF